MFPPHRASATERRPAGSPSEALPREHRLRKTQDHRRLQRRGKRIGGSLIVALYSPGPTELSRFGLTVSRKVGSAVTRNRVKRRLREAMRRRIRNVTGVDIVLIARPAAASAGYRRLSDAVAHVVAAIRREHANT